eukprot:scaffold87377_cov63-Phaeocystis_antarctica.AAC.4
MHTGCGGLVMRSTRLATVRTRRLDCRMPMPARVRQTAAAHVPQDGKGLLALEDLPDDCEAAHDALVGHRLLVSRES